MLSCTLSGKTLSIRLVISRASFVVCVDHPMMSFFWHLSQGSPKAFDAIEPLRIVDSGARPKENGARPYSELLRSVREGLSYHEPQRCEEGVNGTYFLKNKEGKTIAVFKPKDEEGDSIQNPKRLDFAGNFAERGLIEGEGASREVAAYLLDREHFSGVPETEMVTLEHSIWRNDAGECSKTGSLQRFVENDGASSDMGPTRFPAREVHKIGVLDLRIFNTDRHDGNILFREDDEGEMELFPIDHGLSIPPTLDRAWFEWMTWPQAKVPFDQETLDYIDRIDVEADAELLRSLGIREECVKTMVMSSTLLKRGAKAGLTLFDIASMVCREDLEEPCKFEGMYERALVDAGGNVDAVVPAIGRIIDEEIAKM